MAQQATIAFTNKTATFTNLQGRVFKDVELVRGDLDGLIWRREASGGRICYTNLDTEVLESFGISSNRIAVALARAQHKAVADAQYRAAWAAESAAKAQADEAAAAREAKVAPKRQLAARQAADLAQIQALHQEVTASERELRYTRAVALNDLMNGGSSYVNEVAVERLHDREEALQKMISQYEARYHESPPQD